MAPALDINRLWEAVDRQRRERRLTKRKVAAELGVHPAVLSTWQWGDKMPATDSVIRLVTRLDIDLRDYISATRPRVKRRDPGPSPPGPSRRTPAIRRGTAPRCT
jgi:ribosome-binding protein aMBF1 (putative translation factor)